MAVYRYLNIPDSIVVSISACHAEDPGSIPGRGASFCIFCQESCDGSNSSMSSRHRGDPSSTAVGLETLFWRRKEGMVQTGQNLLFFSLSFLRYGYSDRERLWKQRVWWWWRGGRKVYVNLFFWEAFPFLSMIIAEGHRVMYMIRGGREHGQSFFFKRVMNGQKNQNLLRLSLS